MTPHAAIDDKTKGPRKDPTRASRPLREKERTVKTTDLSRRQVIKAGAAAAGAALVTGFPNVVRAQTREIFIGGPGIPGPGPT